MIRRNSDVEIYLPDASSSQASTIDIGDEEDVIMTSEHPTHNFTLPAHLAARFYRKSNARRHASGSPASRRSSISSLHSSISSPGISRDDHMLQHLRRASIIESRKARLADRAAHAEKVRLRAAVAKDGTKSTLKEERALAAQKARERMLSEITAKCEEEVRRAKKKAEDTKEKKAAEHARLRLEREEKFAETERRRLLYQQHSPRRTRAATNSSSEENGFSKLEIIPISRPTAARVIQKAWKSYRARTIVNSYLSLNFSLDRIRSLSFEEVGRLLGEKKVIEATSKVLKQCGVLEAEGGRMSERGAVRIFLSSYLILAHPAQVLSNDGEQEQDLITKARDLLVIFEEIIGQLSAVGISLDSLSTDLQALSESYNMFFSAFHAWKSHDSTVLIEIMLAQFVELELIWQTVKDDHAGGVADDYRQGIRQNQIMLLARLKKLAGADKAMDMVGKALRKAKRDRKRNNSSPQAIPRAVGVATPPAEAYNDGAQSPLSEVFTNVEQRWSEPQNVEKEKLLSPEDRFARTLTALPDNRTVVHELLINQEYRIEQGPYTQIRHKVMKHICDTMRRDVEAGFGTNWTVAMGTVIQDRLLRCLKPGNSLHNLISEVLDPAYIENQCRANAFSYDAFFDFMSNILPKLCAPYRDPEVKAFSEDKSGDAIDRLVRLMGIIDLLSLDHTNFMLQIAAPQLIQEGPGYEQRAFAKDIEEGVVSLERTRSFWRTNHALIVEDMRKRDANNGSSVESRPDISKVYVQGLVDLVLSNRALHEDHIPETLHLDYGRFERLRSQCFKIVATASILLSAKNLLKRDVRSQWKAEADRILALDFTELKPERIQSIIDSSHPMPAATRSQLFSTIKRVIVPAIAASITASATTAPQITVSGNGEAPPPAPTPQDEVTDGVVSFTNPVARLMLTRLRTHVLGRLNASSARDRVRATTTASQSLAAAGMPEFVNEIGQVVEILVRVREVDWTCHSTVYEQVCS